ncbi:MAG: hypothetical protein IJW73_02875, partial [Candidatus Gastranaerophilales bacterium]|nr:hypothetical protein [Candidatus Gastranaerophilales bacterium]
GNLVNNLKKNVLNNEWLQGLYGKKSNEQKAELKKLFTQSADNANEDNSVTDEQLEALYTARTEVLAKKVEQYEAKMAELHESIDEIDAQLAVAAAEITEAVTNVEDNSNDYAKEMNKRVKNAIEAEMKNYQNHPETIGPQGLKTRITAAVNGAVAGAQGTTYYAAIQENLDILNGAQNKYSDLIEKSSNWIKQANLLGKRYGATKSAYDLVNATLFQIGSAKGKYTNSDNNTTYPVYDPDKAEFATSILSDKNYIAAPTNTAYTGEGGKVTLTEINEKYKKYLNPQMTGSDTYSSDNKAIKQLGGAIKAGLLDDLAQTGLSTKEINQFFATNFSNAHLKLAENGGLSIPYGHGDQAQGIFGKLTKFIKGYANGDALINNTWDPAKGNTISSNEQIAALQKFIQYGKLKELANQGFSFQELANLLFNKDSGLFKDTGITYDLEKQAGGANYFMDTVGDKETNELFTNIRTQIKNIWNVDASRGDGTGPINDDGNGDSNGEVNSPVSGRTDPISFRIGDTEYSFVLDKNENDTFDGANEFVGGTGNWLEDLRALADENGKITGDNLKKLKLLATTFTDEGTGNLKNREHDTKFNYDFVSPEELGITELDINAFLKGDSQTNDLNQEANNWNFGGTGEQTDINGSLVFNDAIGIIFKDGTTGTATRKDDTDAYMDAVYSKVYGKNFNGNGYLTENQVDEIINKDYGEFNAFASLYAGADSNLGIVQNSGQLALEAEAFARRNEDQALGRKNALLERALNKAENFEGNVGNWNSMRSKVQAEADSRGIATTEDFWEQCRGYFGRKSGVSAEDIVNQYQKNLEDMKLPSRVQNNEDIIGRTLILAAQQGFDIPAEEIMDAYDSGRAKTPEDLVKLLGAGQQNNNMSFSNINPDSIEDDPAAFDLSGRTNELYEAFNKVFSERYPDENERAEEIVNAIRELCVTEQQNPGYMNKRDAEEIAREFLKK